MRLEGTLYLMFIIILISCDDDDLQQGDRSPAEVDFYPLEEGNEWIYRVDSTIYNLQLGRVRTSTTRLRERINGTVINAVGEEEFILERAPFDTLTEDWGTPRIWTVQGDSIRVIRREGNLRFVALHFPIEVDQRWNGLEFIDRNIDFLVDGERITVFQNWPEEYVISERNQQEMINGRVFEDVITVLQAEVCSLVELRYSIEKYARGVGLVYKELWVLDTQNLVPVTNPCDFDQWLLAAEKGYIVQQMIE